MDLITADKAFNGGAELWVVSASNGDWIRKLDWYLNFLPTRSRYHHPHILPDDMIQITQDLGIEIADLSKKDKAHSLLIPSSQWLPNKFTLIFLKKASAADYVHQAIEHWNELKTSSCRIFLKKHLDKSELKDIVPKGKREGLTFVS